MLVTNTIKTAQKNAKQCVKGLRLPPALHFLVHDPDCPLKVNLGREAFKGLSQPLHVKLPLKLCLDASRKHLAASGSPNSQCALTKNFSCPGLLLKYKN